ncbi:MAG: hypothetical protein Kow0098_03250 [Ignavibacteriaceae bacterium]
MSELKNIPAEGKNQSAGLLKGKGKQHDEELISKLEAYQRSSEKSWAVICDQLGKSATIISLWRKKKYTGDVEAVNDAVEKFLRVEAQKALSVNIKLDYVEIDNNRRCLKVLETALTDGIMAAIIGDTGTSKTYSILQFVKNNDCIYIHANRTYRWPVEYLRRIHTHRFVGKDGRGTMNQLSIDIIHELKGKNVLIIVDQADYLNLAAIDIFRTINEDAGVGVVFVGLPSFLSKLRGNQPEVRQVRDRLKTRLELKRFTREDCKNILDLNFPGLNGYSQDFYTLSNGSIRILESLVYNVKLLIKNKNYQLDKKLIHDAAALLERSVVE